MLLFVRQIEPAVYLISMITIDARNPESQDSFVYIMQKQTEPNEQSHFEKTFEINVIIIDFRSYVISLVLNELNHKTTNLPHECVRIYSEIAAHLNWVYHVCYFACGHLNCRELKLHLNSALIEEGHAQKRIRTKVRPKGFFLK